MWVAVSRLCGLPELMLLTPVHSSPRPCYRESRSGHRHGYAWNRMHRFQKVTIKRNYLLGLSETAVGDGQLERQDVIGGSAEVDFG